MDGVTDKLIDTFRFDTFSKDGHVDIRGHEHMRLLFVFDKGRGGMPQCGFELRLPVTAEALAGYLEATAKTLREVK
jgi:hypothetical protein